ncbi:ABC transporter ATP-binding protein [Anaerocolumna cellulosilytica]|uniref:ABC transporter ATP-binding protein n=1 Tax=Anaerocolumna cellulosilytica TaxID=433286 RepID=A0A6S6R329_9FIRM|nr:ABC transporter ATP-binding protein [Anaerocolumna cellulosilytica]MBB5194493.1 ABC-2 type transport system ATP-binding protein [Anaerocolumna cellulosilytica]BCJ93438.1 ABC transporter ATP-binding protein [Anaerocolumna cellulosilytica]
MIEVKNLTKKYGEHLAVDNLSFTVDKGQILGFLGPNGAGKSTTMNILTGYISATDGTVLIDGHDIFEEPEEAKKSIGYLPEIPPLYQDMTVREYLNFVADIKQVKKSEKATMLTQIMGMTKIADVSERLIKQLSKGYKQRVGLAQSIVGFPDVLILDEPTVGLDPMQIIEIRDLIKELSKKHTIILSSHILSEISAICDRVMIINKGRLLVSDTPDNLSKHIGGSNGLHLKVKGEKDVIKKALGNIDDIAKIDFDSSEADGFVKFTAYSAEDKDIREKVFYALSDARCPIMDMKSTSMSLEDIFLEVTKTEPEAKTAKNPVFKKRQKVINQNNVEQKMDNETVKIPVVQEMEQREEKQDAGNL